MNILRAISVKLITDDILVFSDTFTAYTNAYNVICKVGWDKKIFNGITLHHLTYPLVRDSLPSQLAISARMKATDSLKVVQTLKKKGKKTSCPKSKLCSIRLDANSYNVWFNKNEVSILTVHGRKKFKFQSYDYFDKFRDWRRTSADLIYRDNGIFLVFAFQKNIPDLENPSNAYIGVDRGIKRIAVTSNKQFFKSGKVKNISLRYKTLKAALQKCGTRSAKRHLQKISKKENRFRRDTNHCISKEIVKSIPKGSTIILEDIKGILERSKRYSKAQRGILGDWSFYQLEKMLKYKAEANGDCVSYVDARYTSQKCSKCGHIFKGNRVNQTQFKCVHCGYALNADLNASFNIRNNYLDSIRHPSRASVNEPIVSNHSPGNAGGLVTSS